ncbi:MAG TPA: hypothetical protein PKI72_09005, partial [Giesbergeria sp.]|nr:hypothetical protein [Giesbergeria sp.]
QLEEFADGGGFDVVQAVGELHGVDIWLAGGCTLSPIGMQVSCIRAPMPPAGALPLHCTP